MVLKHILLLLVESFELVSYKIGRSYVYGDAVFHISNKFGSKVCNNFCKVIFSKGLSKCNS